ncbi:MAG: 1,4-dihydroxy-6-naphthoate synthase [Planctomycetota bacterium]
MNIHVGISTCPNDTFAFAALLDGRVDRRGLNWQIELLDIAELNSRLFDGDFDLAKTSFNAAMRMTSSTRILPVGSALGFGVGPLLLAAKPDSVPNNEQQITLCPGETTTAQFLFELFYGNTTQVQHVVFSDIMPRLSNGSADFGVCIHEGRFTYQQSGLHLVADLGTLWERKNECPLPLGGLIVRDQVPEPIVPKAIAAIDESLAIARRDPATALPSMRRWAQEFDDDVLMQHVSLYVNDWTTDLGTSGSDALQKMWQEMHRMGLCGNSGQSGVRIAPRQG